MQTNILIVSGVTLYTRDMAAESSRDATRLANLLRLMLSTPAEGEAMAARTVFLREVQAQGLNLHDIGARIEQVPGGTQDLPTSEPAGPEQAVGAAPGHDIQWEWALAVGDTICDEDWPTIAQWLIDQDVQWAATSGRRLLKPNQRAFAQQQSMEAQTLRPTQAQCAWLICCVWRVSTEMQRLTRKPRSRFDPSASSSSVDPANTSRVAVPTPAPRPRRPRPISQFNNEQRLRWISAVISRQSRAPTPILQAEEPSLFGGEAVRVLSWLAIQHRSWLIDTKKGPIIRTESPSAAQLAAATRVSIRSVRRILAHARESGFLEVARQGGKGRGSQTIYRLVLPDPRRWRNKLG